METQLKVVNYCEFIPTSLLCIKCNNYVTVNINTECTDFILNEMAKTFLCSNCNNNIIDHQNTIHYVNEQISNILHKNCSSFSKINSKIVSMGNSISKVNTEIKELEYIDKKTDIMNKKFILNNFLLNDLIKKIQNDIISLNINTKKSDESSLSFNNKYNNLIDVMNKQKNNLENEIQENINLSNFNKKKIERLNIVVRLSQIKLIEKVDKLEKNVNKELKTFRENYQTKFEKLKIYYLNMEKDITNNFKSLEYDFKNKYNDLDENIKNYYMKNKELKELKRSLILNDKEYKSFKNLIKKINNNLKYFYLLVGLNILFFIFSIYLYLT